jgi:hypothetical protein
MPNCRGGRRRQLALEECKLFGESNMANIDCGLSVAAIGLLQPSGPQKEGSVKERKS